MSKKKILVVIQLVRYGGVELVAINFARNLDKEKYDVSFLLIDPYENQNEAFYHELKDEGFRFIEMPRDAGGYLGKFRFIDNLFQKEHFDAVHSHVIFFSGIVLAAAKKNHIPVRAAHSHIIKWNHSETMQYRVYKTAMRYLLNSNATHKLACSSASGAFLYGKGYKKGGMFVANGINTQKFAYNAAVGKEVRRELCIADDEIVVGHVGTVYAIKNQVFLAQIVSEMLKSGKRVRMLCVGELVDDEPVRCMVQELGITEQVLFAGQRSDIHRLYQAFDIMIFPSLHEALPVSLIEAQASKLPCLISDTVTTEVKFNHNVSFMSLKSSADKWAEEAFRLLAVDRESVDITKLIDTYEISNVIKQLDAIYSGVNPKG